MSFDTTELNRQRHRFERESQVWLFGYGSLIFKPDFPFIAQRRASVGGWQRRFWQGSHDHRGTPSAPGRVVTLVACEQARCEGMAYLITPQQFEHLDRREKNGYLRIQAPINFTAGGTADALLYVADAQNAAWLGAAPIDVMAAQIACAVGPSGTNRDYLFALSRALHELGSTDAHVFELDARVRATATATAAMPLGTPAPACVPL